jgi:hypothetical protein
LSFGKAIDDSRIENDLEASSDGNVLVFAHTGSGTGVVVGIRTESLLNTSQTVSLIPMHSKLN